MQERTLIGGALAAVLLGTLSAGVTHAGRVVESTCPENGDPSVVIEAKDGTRTTEARPFKKGQSCCGDDVKDQLLDSQSDQAGNALERWCIQKRTNLTPQQYYYAFVPKGGKRRWFGGCFFPFGFNDVKISVGRNNKEEIIITQLLQTNEDYGTAFENKPTGTRDRHFSYFNSGNNAGKYRVDKTEGEWVKDGNAGGKAKYKYETDATKTQAGTPKAPPDKPWDLDARLQGPNAPQRTALVDNPGVTLSSALLVAHTDELPTWEYELIVTPWIDQGAVDPMTLEELVASMDGTIHAGDQWLITGDGITGASVSGDAALAAYGGWQVEEMDSQGVTFVATATVADTTLLNAPIGTFAIESSVPAGDVRWGYSGTEVGALSVTVGPSFALPGKCSVAKKKCTARKARDLFKCHARAESLGVLVDEACLLEALEKHRKCYSRFERRGGCLTLDDAAALDAKVNAFVVEVVEDLDAGMLPPVLSACAAGKKKCVGSQVRALLKCHQEADVEGGLDPACVAKAAGKFAGCFDQQEAKFPGACLTSGDAASIQTSIDAFVDDVACQLNPASADCAP